MDVVALGYSAQKKGPKYPTVEMYGLEFQGQSVLAV